MAKRLAAFVNDEGELARVLRGYVRSDQTPDPGHPRAIVARWFSSYDPAMQHASWHQPARTGRSPSPPRIAALTVGLFILFNLHTAHALQCENDVIRREHRTLVLVEVTANGEDAPDEAAKWAEAATLRPFMVDDMLAGQEIVGDGVGLFDGEDLVLEVQR